MPIFRFPFGLSEIINQSRVVSKFVPLNDEQRKKDSIGYTNIHQAVALYCVYLWHLCTIRLGSNAIKFRITILLR